MTPEMRIPFNLTVPQNDTVTSQWFYIGGYDKVEFLVWWTGTITATPKLQGTNAPAVHAAGTPQPSPAATEIVDLADFSNGTPAGSSATAGARDTFENVLPQWVRVSVTETGDSASGTFAGDMTAKSSS